METTQLTAPILSGAISINEAKVKMASYRESGALVIDSGVNADLPFEVSTTVDIESTGNVITRSGVVTKEGLNKGKTYLNVSTQCFCKAGDITGYYLVNGLVESKGTAIVGSYQTRGGQTRKNLTVLRG